MNGLAPTAPRPLARRPARDLPLEERCAHELVESGACPACLWEEATRRSAYDRRPDERRAIIARMLLACQAATPRSLRPFLIRSARRGPWYALRFVRRLAASCTPVEA